ncbi:MAG: hypothetical protein E7386_01405 [Ruminococcaceae bacterium]|nr:hypothetical protein [Oscillospiraceae bacterium]
MNAVRRITELVLSLAFLALIALGFIYLFVPKTFSNSKSDNTDNEQHISRTYTQVNSGEIEHTTKIQGVVCSEYESGTKTIELNGISSKLIKIKVAVGDRLSPNDILYTYKNKGKTCGCNCQIINIIRKKITGEKNKENVYIELLDYDALYISASIPVKEIDQFKKNIPVKVIYNNTDYVSSIYYFGFNVDNEMLPVKLKLPIDLYPGTVVSLIFTTNVVKSGLYVPEEFVFAEDGEYYVYKCNDQQSEESEKTKVKVGISFVETEDGDSVKYIEILSGVSDGDWIVSEHMTLSSSKLKENLKNE